MDTAKLFKHSVSSFWVEILPHFTLRVRVAETAVRVVTLTNFG